MKVRQMVSQIFISLDGITSIVEERSQHRTGPGTNFLFWTLPLALMCCYPFLFYTQLERNILDTAPIEYTGVFCRVTIYHSRVGVLSCSLSNEVR